MPVYMEQTSAFNVRANMGVLVALKSFYDGSGKYEDVNAKVVTLAGYAAPPEVWHQIETHWGAVLSNCKKCPPSRRGTPYFHSKEAMNYSDGYKGWNVDTVEALVNQLQDVLAEQANKGLAGFSCSIDLDGYRRFKAQNPTVKRYEHLCINHCIGTMFQHNDADFPIEIMFDRKEPFEPLLKYLWNEEIDGHRTWWANEVVTVAPVNDAKDSYGLQAADLLAWLANRYHTKGPYDVWGHHFAVMHFVARTHHAFLDEHELSKMFDANGEYRPEYKRRPFSLKVMG